MRVSVNGIAVEAASWPNAELAAVHELLRQRAVAVGMLGGNCDEKTEQNAAIKRLLGDEVTVPSPTEAECRRYYERHPEEFRSGELAFVRHILFQIAPGLPVSALRSMAERTLQGLLAAPARFAERGRALSNCPSSLFGGNLGQLGRGDTVPEFEAAIFAEGPTGILPGLVKTRHGFHIVAIDQRIAGEVIPFEAAQPQIEMRLAAAVQERALAQYLVLLAGEAEIVGANIAAASSPLVQ